MSRIVLACWGSLGDLFPYLAIATELRARGHVPVVVSCPIYRAMVEAEGLAFAPLRPDVRPDDTALLKTLMDPQRGSEAIIRELVVAALRQSCDDIAAAVAGADLVVSHPLTFAAPLVAEQRGLPWLASVLAPMSFFSRHDFPLLPNAPQLATLTRRSRWVAGSVMAVARRITRRWVAPVVALRAELGLPAAGDPLYEGQFSAQGTLALFSTALGTPQADWPARTVVTGFPFFNRAIPMPSDLAAFLDAGPAPVVFTLGSAAVNAAGSFYDESAAAVATLGVRAVMLTGRDPGNVPKTLPPNVLAVGSAPHDLLFPRASVVVHQGGVGTTGQVMRSGRPQLVVPHAHDQFDNADRVRRHGAARVVAAARYTASRAGSAIRALIDDPAYARNADAIAMTVRSEDGAARAATLLVDALTRR